MDYYSTIVDHEELFDLIIIFGSVLRISQSKTCSTLDTRELLFSLYDHSDLYFSIFVISINGVGHFYTSIIM